jgi:hypothetical protein
MSTVVKLSNATYGAATPVYLQLAGSPVIVEKNQGGTTQLRTLVGIIQVYDTLDQVLSKLSLEKPADEPAPLPAEETPEAETPQPEAAQE